MQLIKKRLRGSSLMEVVTAMVIVSLSMALTGVIFGSVFSSSSRMLKQQAWFLVNEWGNKTLLNKDITEEEIKHGPIVIVKSSVVVDKVKGLWLVILKAEGPGGKLLVQRKLLMEVNEDNTTDIEGR